MKNLINRFISIGITEKIPDTEKRYIILINAISLLMVMIIWGYVPLSVIFLPDNTLLTGILTIHGILFLLVPLLNYFEKYLASRLYYGISSIILMAIESLLTGPETYMHFFFLIAPIVPFFIYPEGEKKYKYIMVTLLGATFLMLNYWYMYHEPLRTITDPDVLRFVQWSIFGGLVFLLIMISIYAHYIISQAEKKLAVEHEKAENLLRNILPDKIADRLKDGSHAIADGFEYVSILFADIVGFTELSGKTGPERLVELLNDIFSRFDDIVDRHGLEKIKTIGDAYMIAAGIPEPQKNHAELALLCAREMITGVEDFNRQFNTSLRIRIGINSGPVVAGVIGKKKFIYDLWGDAVNIASRMESHGVAGKIHVSENTCRLLKTKYNFEKRGEIEVKGKGKMTTYFYTE